MSSVTPDSVSTHETSSDLLEPKEDFDSGPPAKDSTKPDIPDISVLEDRMPGWFRSTRSFAAITTVLLVLFLYLNHRPLWHTDVWGHLSYGRAIWDSGLGVLYGDEPLMPLSKGVRFVDTAWLSQLIGYGVMEVFQEPGLQMLFALAITTGMGILAWRFYQRSRSTLVTLLGLGALLVVGWQQLFVNNPNFVLPSALIRPQIAGWVCFVILLSCLTARKWRTAYWGLIPALFAVWTNLHGSFLVGLTLIGCFLVGRGIDIERRTKKLGALFQDRWMRRYFLLLELSAVAVLLNPYGLQIYSAVLEVSSNPNMAGLIEWDPLTLRADQGQALAFAALVLMFLYRWSPRRVQSSEVLSLIAFGGLTFYYSRFMVWLAPLVAYSMVLHGHAVLKRDRKRRPEPKPELRTSLNTVVCLGLLWIMFAFTPFSSHVLHGHEVKPSKTMGPLTPVAATDVLNEMAEKDELPPGLIFHSYEWGDYLLWKG
ncbi:MAG: hypothetical protein KDA84_18910, partial [Planctomycetaceae bacterium]|nr:hypothetical protein [Planctomycetaceae bacterium]